MLNAQEPPRYVEEIDCSEIHTFKTIEEAKAFKELKEQQLAPSGKKFMVLTEQGGGKYYVMPNYDGVLVGSCYSD